jgi:hypothetical protein
MPKATTGPFNPARVADNFPASDPVDQWCDELEMLVHGLSRPSFVAKLRTLPPADHDRYLAGLQALKRSLAELLYTDGQAKAYREGDAGRSH